MKVQLNRVRLTIEELYIHLYRQNPVLEYIAALLT